MRKAEDRTCSLPAGLERTTVDHRAWCGRRRCGPDRICGPAQLLWWEVSVYLLRLTLQTWRPLGVPATAGPWTEKHDGHPDPHFLHWKTRASTTCRVHGLNESVFVGVSPAPAPVCSARGSRCCRPCRLPAHVTHGIVARHRIG